MFSKACRSCFSFCSGVKNLAELRHQQHENRGDDGHEHSAAAVARFQAAQPHIKVIQGYGLTETSPMITLVEPEQAEAKMGSIGRAVPGVEVRIVDEERQRSSASAKPAKSSPAARM